MWQKWKPLWTNSSRFLVLGSWLRGVEPRTNNQEQFRPPSESLQQRWHQFEQKAAGYSIPMKRFWSRDGVPSCIGGLYVGLYPKADFKDLIDFNLYQNYSSSVQQDIIADGAPDADSFFPESAVEGTNRFFARLPEFEKRRNARDIRQFLGNLRLPKEVEWVTGLEFEEWIIDSGDESLELTASTKQGYLTMFVVDYGR